MKKIRTLVIIVIAFFLVTSCSFVDDIQKRIDPGDFDEYTGSIFNNLLAGSELNLHFLFKNQTSYGFEESYEPTLPTPSSGRSIFGDLYLNIYFGSIKNYDYEQLNFDQQMTYNILVNLLDNYNNSPADSSYLTSDYLGSYLGYQAQLPLLLAEYKFHKVQDIINYFKFIDLVPETFRKYIDFENEKAEKGYGMPDYVIEKVINQCLKFTGNIDNHFLITTFNEKIHNADFLTLQQKHEYISTNVDKVSGPLKEGYEIVRVDLANIYGLSTNSKGLYYYTKNDLGKKVYEKTFQEVTGYNTSISEAISYIDSKIAAIRNRALELEYLYPNIKDVVANISLYDGDPLNQLTVFKELYADAFPVIETYPTINIKYVDPSMEDNFSPAAYMSSPIDDYTDEFIYLNTKKIAEQGNNYLFTTLAHEAIAGHMYQNIYFKSIPNVNPLRKVLKNRGYMEGWATYAELFSYDLVSEKTLSTIEQAALEYMRLMDEFNGAIYCRIDASIHYLGWDEVDIANNYGINPVNSRAIFEQLVEVYTNPQMYYFTYFKLRDLYNLVKSNNNNFTSKELHQLILECGPVPLRYVEDVVKNYYNI